jgi:hypothetical protein
MGRKFSAFPLFAGSTPLSNKLFPAWASQESTDKYDDDLREHFHRMKVYIILLLTLGPYIAHVDVLYVFSFKSMYDHVHATNMLTLRRESIPCLHVCSVQLCLSSHLVLHISIVRGHLTQDPYQIIC